MPTSSAALKVADVAKEKKKLYFNITAATTDLTGKSCNKYTFHYAYDTYMLANGTGKTVTDQGAKNWYLVYPDYLFGQDMTASFEAAVKKAGGTVVAKDPAPFPHASGDYSTYLLKAPNLTPKPDVLGTMQAGAELVALVKQYNEFKLRDKGVGLAVGLMFLTDIHSLTPDALGGHHLHRRLVLELRPEEQRVRRPVLPGRPAPGRPSPTRRTTRPRCSTWKPCRPTGPMTPTPSSSTSRAGRSRMSSCARARSAPRTTAWCTTPTSPRSSPSKEVKEPWDYVKVLKTIPAAEAFRAPSADCKL